MTPEDAMVKAPAAIRKALRILRAVKPAGQRGGGESLWSMTTVLASPDPLDGAVEALRAGQGYAGALLIVNADRVARGEAPLSRWELRELLRRTGRLEAFPKARPARVGRPAKPELTPAECKLATAALAGPPGERWRHAVDAVNAGREPEHRLSERTLRDRLRRLGILEGKA